MSKLTWTAFSGIRPKADPRLLPDGSAQVAENINTERGGLRPIRGQLDVMALAKTGVVKTIYRFGQALQSATQFWFHWTTEVDVVKGPISDDTAERTYWTGHGAPKYTTAQAGTVGSDLPAAWFPLGVSPPASAPLLTAQGTAPEGATKETRVYVYTYVTANGEESAPSAPGTVEIFIGQSVDITGMEAVAENGALVNTKRIYRAQRGVYLQIGEVPAATSAFNDTVSSDNMGAPCPTVDWDMPPATLFGLHSGPNGMMIGLDGYTVRLCEPFRPHAWPQKYSQTTPYPAVGVGQFGQSFVILTTGMPSVLTGSHPGNMSMATAGFYQPCLSKRSIVSAAGNVVWASPDGLVSLGAEGEQNLTADLFTPEQWRALNPETLLGAWHEGWYIGVFETAGVRRGFMLRPSTKEWVDLPDLTATAMFRDTVGDALYLCIDNRIQQFRAGDYLPYRWKSHKVTTPLTDYVAARVTGGYPITFKLYKDGVLRMTKVVKSDEPFHLPAKICRTWEVEVSGTNEVLGIAMATTMGEM